MKVFIYVLTDVHYYAFYIQGLYKNFGKRNVIFNLDRFPNFGIKSCALILQNNEKSKKIIIDAYDSCNVRDNWLKWCDVYAKVNVNNNHHYPEKVLNIGPSFGIQIWNYPQSVYYSLSNYFLGKAYIHNKKEFFAAYWRQLKRERYKRYHEDYSLNSDYVYFISSIWKKEKRTNEARYKFIKACQKLEKINFEGGFADRSDHDNLGYHEVLTPRISLSEYIDKIKKSLLVFNTPAVEDCHGWKLAEFFALGKAIISTPSFNKLPDKNERIIHYIQHLDELSEAIQFIQKNAAYRESLEVNSKKYWEKHLSPTKVIDKIKNYLF
ncbi:glycosyltransferase [Zunongwangia sp.]|uniref:glycosyltransferase n=1 Tax=Zunongwangia sp. TaxID=1965325 RepID=UPI003AA891C9